MLMDAVIPIENPLEALQMALAFSPRDWATEKRDAWIYGIALGWDDDCYPEFNRKFGWGKETFKRIQRLHVKFEALCRAALGNKLLTWIPVNERLPEAQQRVLVRCDVIGTTVGWIVFGKWVTDLGDGVGTVTHWMPLPAPPDARKPEQEAHHEKD